MLDITNAVNDPDAVHASAQSASSPTDYDVTVSVNNWIANTGWGQTLYCPNLQIKVTNNQSSSASRITVHVIFYDESEKSVWSDETSYLVSSSDSPLASGYSKTAYVTSSVGYTSKPSTSRLATVKAEIYVNDVLYKTVNINKTFGN